MTTALVVLASLVLLVAMAVAVAVRIARPVASLDQVRSLAESGNAGAGAALRTLEEGDRSTGVLQVLVPVAGVLSGWLAVVAARRVAEGSWLVPAMVVAALVAGVVVALLFDAAPRALALAAPERVLVVLGWPYRALTAFVGPLVTVSGWLATAALLPVGMWLDGGRGRGHTTDELAELVADHGDSDRGRRLLAGALGFIDVCVGDLMAQRDQLVTVPRTSTVAEAEELVHRSGHSRVLVVGDSGEVTGFLHAKDLLVLADDRRDGLLPAGLVRIALRVEPGDRVQDLLLRMRRARRHVAVVEEGQELLGLITLEDVLEAIVGDIRDESDVAGENPRDDPVPGEGQ